MNCGGAQGPGDTWVPVRTILRSGGSSKATISEIVSVTQSVTTISRTLGTIRDHWLQTIEDDISEVVS